jgi:hypothetical protein
LIAEETVSRREAEAASMTRMIMDQERTGMKRRYEKPSLDKRERLSGVTAACTPSICS